MNSQADEIQALLELTGVLLERTPLERALLAVTDTALAILPGEHASVRILDDTGRRLLSGARSGAGLTHRPLSLRPDEGVVGWVVQNRRPARIVDAHRDPRFKRARDQGFTIRSLLNVPLWSADRVVGVLGVTSEQADAYSDRDEMLAMLLANCVAPAIERARLERLTITDHLTMAYNQRYLATRLAEEIGRARRHRSQLNLLLLDLDRFKAVNDRHGHAAGDVVLQSFAERVRSAVRLSDVLIRRGGDEFVLLLPDLAREQAVAAAERIRAAVSSEPISAGGGVTVDQTVSIGAAAWDGVEDADALEARADQALYRAKRAGRNRTTLAGADPPRPPANEEPPAG